MSKSNSIAGIDFGSQLAGTTSFAVKTLGNNHVTILTSIKGKSADAFIKDCVATYSPLVIGIDAPLSLPLFYTNPQQYPDNNYRFCDRELSAMSPMFLGGLTSRAMKLKFELEQQKIQCIEVYPKAFAHSFALPQLGYKKAKESIEMCVDRLKKEWVFQLDKAVSTWHEFDALLALAISERYIENNAKSVGNEEGYIFY